MSGESVPTAIPPRRPLFHESWLGVLGTRASWTKAPVCSGHRALVINELPRFCACYPLPVPARPRLRGAAAEASVRSVHSRLLSEGAFCPHLFDVSGTWRFHDADSIGTHDCSLLGRGLSRSESRRIWPRALFLCRCLPDGGCVWGGATRGNRRELSHGDGLGSVTRRVGATEKAERRSLDGVGGQSSLRCGVESDIPGWQELEVIELGTTQT